MSSLVRAPCAGSRTLRWFAHYKLATWYQTTYPTWYTDSYISLPLATFENSTADSLATIFMGQGKRRSRHKQPYVGELRLGNELPNQPLLEGG
jgi:hypothetical protein